MLHFIHCAILKQEQTLKCLSYERITATHLRIIVWLHAVSVSCWSALLTTFSRLLTGFWSAMRAWEPGLRVFGFTASIIHPMLVCGGQNK